MISPIIFRDHILWKTKDNDRKVLPHCRLRLHHTSIGGCHLDFFGLLDTGANWIQVPKDVAPHIGVDLNSCRTTKVCVASGEKLNFPWTRINVSLRDVDVDNVVVIFGPKNVPVLIGVSVISKSMIFGLDRFGWLYRESTGGFWRKKLESFILLIRWIFFRR